MAKHRVTMAAKERADLEHVIRHRSSKSAQVRRSYLLLAADEQGGKRWTDERIGSAYGASVSTMEPLRGAGF